VSGLQSDNNAFNYTNNDYDDDDDNNNNSNNNNNMYHLNIAPFAELWRR